MLSVTLLSRVRLSAVAALYRYGFEWYAHFSRLLFRSAVRFSRGSKRQPGYGSLLPGESGNLAGPRASPWRERRPGEAGEETGKSGASRRGTPRHPDPKENTARFGPPVRAGATRKEKEVK